MCEKNQQNKLKSRAHQLLLALLWHHTHRPDTKGSTPVNKLIHHMISPSGPWVLQSINPLSINALLQRVAVDHASLRALRDQVDGAWRALMGGKLDSALARWQDGRLAGWQAGRLACRKVLQSHGFAFVSNDLCSTHMHDGCEKRYKVG